jgi:hypothetical protein
VVRELNSVLTGAALALLMISVSSPICIAKGQSGASPAGQTQAYEGMVTDTHCGARHSAAIGETAADCVIFCVRGGAQFALVDGDTTYVLEGDSIGLKRVAGQRARILGTLNSNKISVTSIAAPSR